MSDISMEDEVDCSEFVKNETKPAKHLISISLSMFACLNMFVCPNQVFATSGLNKNQTKELSSLIEEDNAEGCD